MSLISWLTSLKQALRQTDQTNRRSRRRGFSGRRRIEPLEDRTLLSAIVVTSLADNTTGDGQVTLREAIQAANTDLAVDGSTAGSGADTITFAAGLFSGGDQTIQLSIAGDHEFGPSALAITTPITISGPTGSHGLTIARDSGVANLRLFVVSSAGNLTLQNSTLSGGTHIGGNGGNSGYGIVGGSGGGAAGLGGAIFNQGTLAIQNSTLTGNTARGGNGGVYSGVSGFNQGAGGGGLDGDGGNGVGGSGGGGVGGSVGVFGLIGNGGGGFGFGFGGGGGGGVGSEDGDSGGGFGGFGGFGGGGGGGGFRYGYGGYGGFGGGRGGQAQGNSAHFLGSGGYGGGGAGLGGAVFNQGGAVTITNSTLSGNSVAGGVGDANGGGASSGQAFGGAVFSRNGSVTVLNSTFTSNAAANGGTGLYNLGDGATATAVLNNTILGGAATSPSDFVGNTINGGTSTTSGVGNLIRSATGFSGTVVSSFDPNLAALADNGGPTFTHLLNPGSPALDVGNNAAASALTTDQRGFTPRAFGAAVDIGSVEVGATEPSTVTNAPPTLDNAIADQPATEDAPFSFAFAENTFSDVDAGDSLTYSTSSLPSWLSFTASTRTFSGTPANADVGFVDVTVTATDLSSETASETFRITVANTNDPPTLTISDAAGNLIEGNGTATLSDNGTLSFDDIDTNDTVTVSQTSNNNLVWSGGTLAAALVAGLSVDQDSWDYSTSENLDFLSVGETITFSFDVVATDDSGAINAASAATTVTITINGTNDDPILVNEIAAQVATETILFSFTFAEQTFDDIDANDVLTYSATQADGSDLPTWLTFDPDTRTFSGTPTNTDVGRLSITVTAMDSHEASASAIFDLAVLGTAITQSNGVVTITDIGGPSHDAIEITIDGDNLVVTLEGRTTEIPLAGLTELIINGGGGDDTLTVDLGGGRLPFNITFNGGAGGHDTLVVTGFDESGAFNAYNANFTNRHDGNIQFRNGGTILSTVSYTGLEPITLDGTPDEIVFNLPSTNDTDVRLLDIGGTDGIMRLTGSTFETTDFSISAATSITINANRGNDIVTIPSLDANYLGALIVNGGDGNDRLIVGFAVDGNSLSGGLTYNGGRGSRNTLLLNNLENRFDELTYRSTTTHNGAFDLSPLGGGPLTNITFAELYSAKIEGTAVSDMVFELSARNDVVSLSDISGTGNERFSSSGQMTLDFPLDGVSSLIVNGNGGNDIINVYSIDAVFAGLITLNGNDGNDTLSASGAKTTVARVTTGINTELNGGIGTDRLTGGIGNDTLNGGDGKDRLYGSSGNDLLLGGADNDYLNGGSGNDTLLGDAGKDTLQGSSGADICLGGNDDDKIYGGSAPRGQTDTVAGQAGNDRIYDQAAEIDEAFTFDFFQ